MKLYQGNIYHIYNRGNNSQPIFFDKENYLYFLKKMRRLLLQHCDILAWCLMPNHFHWMIKVKENSESALAPELNKSIGILLRSYTRAINPRYGKSGSLFQAKTKSKDLNKSEIDRDNYPLICFLYIHQNPLKAGLVEAIGNWRFSSFRDYSGKRKGTLCNIEMTRKLLDLPFDSQKFMNFSQKTIPERYTDRIL